MRKVVFGMQRDAQEQNKALRILDLYLKIPQEAAERVMRFWRVRAQAAAAATAKPAGKPKLHDIADRMAAAAG